MLYNQLRVLIVRSLLCRNNTVIALYIRIVLLPNLNELRTLAESVHEEYILLIDDCLIHVTEAVLALLRDARVRLITWVPHTTQTLHHLDVSLFGVLKRGGQFKLPFDDDQDIADFLFKVYRIFK
jgi:hypothetical protein